MKTSEKFLASKFFVKLIKSTLGVNTVKIRNTISALTEWDNYCNIDNWCQNPDYQYQIYAYSSVGFQKLDVVGTICSYDEGESKTKAEYYNLARALIAQSPDSIFIVEVCSIINDYELENKYATIYNAPDLTNYLKK